MRMTGSTHGLISPGGRFSLPCPINRKAFHLDSERKNPLILLWNFLPLGDSLQNPQIYPEKPVNFGFLDFTTLEKRNYYCQQEVGLNRRLGKGAIIPAVVEKIATKTAPFHAGAATSPEISKFGNILTIRPGFETSDEALQAGTGGQVNNQDFRLAVENLKRAGYAGEEIGLHVLGGLPGQSAEKSKKAYPR